VLETAGLGDAVALHVLETVIASRLWLPFSLIEIGFRNAVDSVITANHAAGADWLVECGSQGTTLIVADVRSRPAFRIVGDDGTVDDPIAEATRMAGQQPPRTEISRDDLIAHLMLGFWVNRCPEAAQAESGIDVWALIAAKMSPPFDDLSHLAKVMRHLLRTRNRVAHHEPLLFRSKHIFHRGLAKEGAGLVASLQDAIPPFVREVELTVQTAKALAPMASKHLDPLPDLVRSDIAPLEATLGSERRRLREARDARLAARQAERTAEIQKRLTD
jgi:hypothetical protein